MKNIFLTIVLLMFNFSIHGQSAGENAINNRIILIFSPHNNYELYEAQLRLLAKDPIGLDQRGILIYEIFASGGINPDGTGVEENEVIALRHQYKVPDSQFRVILIDRNNMILAENDKPVSSAELFRIIDDKEKDTKGGQ